MKVYLEKLPWGSRAWLVAETEEEERHLQFLDGAKAETQFRQGVHMLSLVTPRAPAYFAEE